MILIAMLIFPGIFLFGQFDPPVNPKNVVINPDLIIQVGAFRQEPNALALESRLSAVLNNSVDIVTEDGYFKVRVTGFSNQEEMEELFPTLAFLGMKSIWVLPVKKQEEIEQQAVVLHDTIEKPVNDSTALPLALEEISGESQQAIALQVEVFHDKSKALEARRRIISELNLTVEIVQEWEYYKVFVTGFRTTEEAEKYFSPLAKLGYPQISLIENYKKK